MRVSWRAATGIAATVISVILACTAAGPAQAVPANPVTATRPAAMTYSAAGELNGVAAAATNNAWAVGYAGASGGTDYILMLHWNGSAWSRVTTSHVLTGQGVLNAITVVNSKDAWAVGSTGSDTHPHTLVLHWNGSTWSALTSPAPVANGALSAVWANTKEVWAVGSYSTGPAAVQTVPLSFEEVGTRWTRHNSTGAYGVTFDGVTTTTAGVTLATGLFTGMITGSVARWNGHAWAWTTNFPEFATYHWLNGIAAGTGGTAFAVGLNTSGSGGAISIEWNGRAWVRAPMPSWANPDTVAWAPGGAGFSAGAVNSGGSERALIMRWNGHQWGRVSSPATAGQLTGLGFATLKYGWAVGETDPYTSAPKTLIEHWNGSTWS
ncbi:MAG: hypothetical protein JWM19_2296 [Actinomycetia bacterium]|nr:hypothetical protein [Actinomycetes bacterium]